MYVIMRNDGTFVTKPGQKDVYSRELPKAQKFFTFEEAQVALCPSLFNEIIVDLTSNVDGWYGSPRLYQKYAEAALALANKGGN